MNALIHESSSSEQWWERRTLEILLREADPFSEPPPVPDVLRRRRVHVNSVDKIGLLPNEADSFFALRRAKFSVSQAKDIVLRSRKGIV